MLFSCYRVLGYVLYFDINKTTIERLDQDLSIADWWVLSQIKTNLSSATFFRFLDAWMVKNLYKENGNIDDIFDGMGLGRQEVMEKFKVNFKNQKNQKTYRGSPIRSNVQFEIENSCDFVSLNIIQNVLQMDRNKIVVTDMAKTYSHLKDKDYTVENVISDEAT